MATTYRCKTMERKGFEIDLRMLNDCTSKYPGLTFVGYYNIYPEYKKPYVLEDHMETVYRKRHIDIGGYLKNGIDCGDGVVFDKHHDELVDMYTGLVVSAHDNYRVSKDTYNLPYDYNNEQVSDVVRYGTYIDEW